MSRLPVTRGAGISDESNILKSIETFVAVDARRSDYRYYRRGVSPLVVQPAALWTIKCKG
jgi:hypothetical protein